MMVQAHPNEWVTVPLSYVTGFQNGFAFKSSTYRESGAFVIRIGNVQTGGISLNNPAYVDAQGLGADSFLLCDGDMLVSLTGNVGRVATIKKKHLPAVLNQRVARALPVKSIERGFIFHLMRSEIVQKELLASAKGAAQLNISTKDLARIDIPLPPIPEQKIIADKLDSLLTQVETTKVRLERIPNILKTFRQSVLAAAVSGKLTAEWRKENGLPSPREIQLGKIVCEGPQNGLYKSQSFYGQGVRIIRIDSFYDGEIVDWNNVKRLLLENSEYSKWKLDIGDILVNRVNSIEYLGKSAIVRELPEPAVFESNIMKFRVNPEEAIPEYIVQFLCSPTGLSQLRKNAKLAVNQASINQQDVKGCKIYLPGISEQAEIVRRIAQLFAHADRIEQQAQAALERVNNLTQSILVKAFRGELTEQWRKDNPELIRGENSAAALLDKIKAERATKPAKKTRTGKKT